MSLIVILDVIGDFEIGFGIHRELAVSIDIILTLNQQKRLGGGLTREDTDVLKKYHMIPEKLFYPDTEKLHAHDNLSRNSGKLDKNLIMDPDAVEKLYRLA